MNILSKIQTLWAADSALNALLPATRLTTGRVAPDTILPYATLSGPELRQEGCSNMTYYDRGRVFIQIWSQTYAQGRAIQDRVCAANGSFRGADIVLEDGSVMNLRLETRNVLEEMDEPTERVWQFTVEFVADVGMTR